MDKHTWSVSRIHVRYRKVILSDQLVRNSADIYRLFMQFWDKGSIDLREDFGVLLFDTKNQMIGYYKLFSGGVDRSNIDTKLVYSVALAGNAQSIAVAHNHPSGNIAPSANDYHLTKTIYNGCDVLGLRLLDHLVISRGRYFSFKDEGYI